MHRHVHYEAAFEDYLRVRDIPYVAVDEARRAQLTASRIKSFDFLVYPKEGPPWVVDIKGRKFPYESSNGGKRYWENWVSRDDLDGLADWDGVFQGDFEPRFIFAYQLGGPVDHWPAVEPHEYQGVSYAFYSVRRTDYLSHCKDRSESWQTVSVPQARFRELATPVTR